MSPQTATNLKILATVVVTLGIYTWVSSAIPQLESEVPREIAFGEEVTPEELVAAGEELFNGAGGCTACHGLGERAPELRQDYEGEGTIGARCGRRIEGMSCKEYLYQSMVDPNAYLVDDFPPIMPPAERIMSTNQIWAIIAYLQSVGGEVTVTAEDLAAEEGGSGGSGATGEASGSPAAGEGSAGGGEGEGGEAVALMEANACFGCHTLGDRGMEVGPPLDGIGSRRSPEYLRRSIVDPAADVPEGYEALAGSMPPNFGDLLTEAEIDAIVDFLAAQTEEGAE